MQCESMKVYLEVISTVHVLSSYSPQLISSCHFSPGIEKKKLVIYELRSGLCMSLLDAILRALQPFSLYGFTSTKMSTSTASSIVLLKKGRRSLICCHRQDDVFDWLQLNQLRPILGVLSSPQRFYCCSCFKRSCCCNEKSRGKKAILCACVGVELCQGQESQGQFQVHVVW